MVMRHSYFWTVACMMDVLNVHEQTRRPQRELLCVVCPNFTNVGDDDDND